MLYSLALFYLILRLSTDFTHRRKCQSSEKWNINLKRLDCFDKSTEKLYSNETFDEVSGKMGIVVQQSWYQTKTEY